MGSSRRELGLEDRKGKASEREGEQAWVRKLIRLVFE